MLILGLNAFHADASAALFADGELVAAAEEERFNRVKHASGLPVQASRWVLSHAGVKPEQLDHIALSKSPHVHKARRAVHGILHTVRQRSLPRERLAARARTLSLHQELGHALDADLSAGCGVHPVEHHPSHIASAFFASPFDDAAVCSVDGLGDFVSMAWGTGRGSKISVDHRVFFPHSLGFFYTAITQYLGFPHYGDEYKVMGLAPYGTPKYLPEMRRILTAAAPDFRLTMDFFRHGRESIKWKFDSGLPVVGALFAPELEELLGPARHPAEPLDERHRDVAASAQARLEEVLLPILAGLKQRTGLPALAMAGGVALNVTANSLIADATGFEKVFIQPAASDAGTSIGAALYVAHQTLGASRGFVMEDVYLGPSFTAEECAAKLEEAGVAYERLDEATLCRRAAELIAEAKIVGWFQGRMEFGPRALGNRSIVCDPRNPQMKDIVNSRTKRRESFRPFAPSVLAERASEVYEIDGPSPYMLYAPKVRPAWRDRLPAVTHVDGTGRIQTVDRRTNERYWKLIHAFDTLTGVPLVLNTSFNESEPIVCTPEEAIACYLRADMDVLVLEDLLVTRRA
ncbi:MAG: carbamoyltransferase [Acidimicrobiales bacterium]